jgi:hypothetical protein
MFKITLLFESNEKGIYTKEEETATDKTWVEIKKQRMIKRWLTNLCPYIDLEKFYCSLPVISMDKMDLEDIFKKYELLLKCQLEFLNKNDNGCRKFDITVEEMEIEKEKNLYVAYWVDSRKISFKKSEIKILGVFTTKERAQLVCNNYEQRTYSKDYYSASYYELPLNKDVSYDELYI